MSTSPRCDRTAAWSALRANYLSEGQHFDLREAFASDTSRFARFGVGAPGLYADLSKNLISEATLKALLELARECQIEARRDAMLAGEPVNHTEGRAVLHTALRAPRGKGLHSEEVHGVLDRLFDYVEQVRDTATSGIKHIVNIGIGGSDLGPQMVVPALDAFCHPGLTLHFVSNVDGHDITPVLRKLKPQETLFIIASKTFTTQETMANAYVAKAWFDQHGGTDTARHFVATTTNVKAAAEFGITTTFGFWDWVGGRYSLWSAIGLPIALAIGADNFRALLAGARAMDEHFASGPAGAEPAGAAGPDRRLVPQFPRLHQPQRGALPPGAQAPAGLPAAAGDGKQRQVRRSRRRAAALRHQPRGVGRARHQRPARLLPDAAPGHRRDPGGVHPGQAAHARPQRSAHQAAGQWPGAVPGADAGQDRPRRRWEEKAPTASKSLDAQTIARHRTFPAIGRARRCCWTTSARIPWAR